MVLRNSPPNHIWLGSRYHMVMTKLIHIFPRLLKENISVPSNVGGYMCLYLSPKVFREYKYKVLALLLLMDIFDKKNLCEIVALFFCLQVLALVYLIIFLQRVRSRTKCLNINCVYKDSFNI